MFILKSTIFFKQCNNQMVTGPYQLCGMKKKYIYYGSQWGPET